MIDGMIVREMYRRCQHDQAIITRVYQAIKAGNFTCDGKSAEMVNTLWQNYLESGFLSVRILDYLYDDTLGLVDEDVIIDLIKSMPAQPFQLVTVHDCFRCHPNYGNDLRRQYNTILADIAGSNMLNYICAQVTKQPIKTRKVGHIPRNVILNANYTLS